jgi:hypothetical protein
MKIFISFLFLFVFLGELTLDCSTPFVRARAVSYTKAEPFGSGAQAERDETKSSKHSKIFETHSHAAVEAIEPVPQFRGVSNIEAGFAEIIIPNLNPPTDRLNRPPIS